MSDRDKVIFPSGRVPEDPGAGKLLGLYPQRQGGLWMQRGSVLGGAPAPDQWRALGRIARQLTPAAPLHLTTRQDMELHDLSAENVPLAQQGMAEVGLTGLAAGGDSLRNVTVCPCSGILSGSVDLHPLARLIRRTLEIEEGIFALPRKFKISLSCCQACGQPWINDLGFVVRRKKGQYGFRLIGAGSLGSRPAAGIVLFDWLAAGDVLAVAVAAVRVFAAHGDREHRNRARFRHVRERVGDEKFTALLREEFEKAKSERTWPEVALAKPGNEFPAHLALTFPNGDVTPAAADALADLAGRDDLRVRIANHHRVMVFGRDRAALDAAVGGLPPLREAAEPKPSVIACPGTRWCSRALADTNGLADRIRRELEKKSLRGVEVCVSGCPNGCAHSRVADIGLTGSLDGPAGEKKAAYDLFVGGDGGRSAKLAEPVARRLSAEEAIAEVLRVAKGQQ